MSERPLPVGLPSDLPLENDEIESVHKFALYLAGSDEWEGAMAVLIEAALKELVRGREALNFIWKVLDGDHRSLGSLCGENVCWLCAAESAAKRRHSPTRSDPDPRAA